MRIFLLFILTLTITDTAWATPSLANIFTTDIYTQDALGSDASDDDKIAELKKRKLAELQTQKLAAIDTELSTKRELLSKYEKDDAFAVGTGLLVNVGLLYLGGPIGIGASIGIKYIFDKPKSFGDAGFKALETTFAPTDKISEAIAPTGALRSEIRKLESEKTAFEKAATTGPLFGLECLYVKKKHLFPETWVAKIEDLLIASYLESDCEPSQLVINLIWHPFSVKGFSMEERRDLVEGLSPGYKKSLLTKLTDTKKRHCGYCQTNNQDAFQTELEEIAETLGLPILVIDAQDYDPCTTLLYGVPAGTEPLKVATDTFRSGAQAQKGLFLSALANLQNISNCILVIKNIDEWTMTGNENLAWVLKLFDLQTKTFPSKYYGLDVDWSHLNVIASGRTPKAELDSAFKSRVAGYVM